MSRFLSFKVSIVWFVISMVFLVLFLQEKRANQTQSGDLKQEVDKPESLAERLSYAYGVVAYRQLVDMGNPFSVEYFFAGLKTAEAKGNILMSDAEIDAAVEEAEKAMMERQESKADKTDLELGEAFLLENGKKEGVITTNSGLQYEVIKPGEGPTPVSTDTVKVHYHGTLIDGTVFDSSLKRGAPVSFRLDQVIAGWTEGVGLMSKGAKYRLYIPNELAYGVLGSGGNVRPYCVLIFDIELIDIVK